MQFDSADYGNIATLVLTVPTQAFEERLGQVISFAGSWPPRKLNCSKALTVVQLKKQHMQKAGWQLQV